MSFIMILFMLLMFMAVSAAAVIVGVLLRLRNGVGRAFRRGGRDEEKEGDVIRTDEGRKGRVFDDNEGEYVDFEEIKD